MKEYLDRYEGVKSEILSTTRFDENSDLRMTYLGRVNIARENKITAEEKFLISEHGFQQESYWMVPNVRYYGILELANNTCPSCTIYIVNHFICYPNLLQKLRGFK